MRITRTAQEVSSAKMNRVIANLGCKACPCCGETKSSTQYLSEGVYDKGIFGGLICRTWSEGLFRPRYMRVDCYSCETCGAQWESEPYEEAL